MTLPEPALSLVTEDLSPRPAWQADSQGAARLRGTRCTKCQVIAFPGRGACHRCASTGLVPAAITAAGTLYSWSTVHVSGSRTVPYTLGYVDLPEDVRVLAIIGGDPARLRPDCAVRLATDATDDTELTFVLADAETG
jgi:uncharacterized OB-fold protein